MMIRNKPPENGADVAGHQAPFLLLGHIPARLAPINGALASSQPPTRGNAPHRPLIGAWQAQTLCCTPSTPEE
jgi:hypothetical protein